jgi:hypothetical protein
VTTASWWVSLQRFAAPNGSPVAWQALVRFTWPSRR